jgi:predicted transcriptional regulator
MLARLSKGEANVSDLAKPFLKTMSLPAVTKHLKVLEQAGLVTKTRDAQWRPCKLNGPALKSAADWMEEYRQFWEESLDRLGEYLKAVQSQSTDAPPSPDGLVASATSKRGPTKSSAKKKPKGKKHAR